MPDYNFLKDSNNNISGIWLRDPEDAESTKLLFLLIKHGYQDLKSEYVATESGEPVSLGILALSGSFNVVPNTITDSGGCFVMFGSPLDLNLENIPDLFGTATAKDKPAASEPPPEETPIREDSARAMSATDFEEEAERSSKQIPHLNERQIAIPLGMMIQWPDICIGCGTTEDLIQLDNVESQKYLKQASVCPLCQANQKRGNNLSCLFLSISLLVFISVTVGIHSLWLGEQIDSRLFSWGASGGLGLLAGVAMWYLIPSRWIETPFPNRYRSGEHYIYTFATAAVAEKFRGVPLTREPGVSVDRTKAAQTVTSEETIPTLETVKVDGVEVPITIDIDEFCKTATANRACVLVMKTKDYAQIMMKVHDYLSDKFGEKSDFTKAVTSARLICGDCQMHFPDSYALSLMNPDIFGRAVFGATPGYDEFGRTGKCPKCGCEYAFYLYDNLSGEEITERDLDALRKYWRYQAQQWWQTEPMTAGLCDRCSSPVSQGDGYLSTSWLLCEKCCNEWLGPEAIEHLRKDPNYFGASVLRKARHFAAIQ